MKRLTSFLAIALTIGIALGFAFPATATESHDAVPPAIQAQMEQTRAKLMQWLREVNSDVFRPGTFLAKDELLLKDGTTITGKILDYGPNICFVDETTGRRIVPRGTIKKMTASWGDPPPAKPNVPDLNVTYIERLPRYRSNHANVSYDTKGKGVYLPKPNPDPVWPPKGTKATFKAHVVNKGPVGSKPFTYEWLIDGKRKARGKHAALNPGEEVVIDFSWRWQDGAHTVTFKVIPNGADFSAWNNAHTDRTDSLGLSFVASRHVYDGFNNVLNMVESFSYEDWVQYHLQVMNYLFAASVHPGSPLGCFERVRVDYMVTFPDDEWREKYNTVGMDDRGYAYHEGRWGFSPPWDPYDWRAANIDWGLIHELGHQLGIIDYYSLDFWRYVIFARDKNGDLIDVGYSYPATGMMRSHGPFAFTEVTAIAMNLQKGKHRGFFGDYLFYLPKECGIRILDFNGRPIPNAQLRIFRRAAGVHTTDMGKRGIPEDPVFEGTTDADGVFMLPNEEPPFVFTTDSGFTRAPSPFGDALVLSDTGLMLIEIWQDDRRDAQFTDVTWFVIGRGRGYEDKYIKDIPTFLPGEDQAVKPPHIVSVNTDGWNNNFKVRWNNVPDNTAVQYKIYTFTDGLPRTRQYIREHATVNAQGPFAISIHGLRGWVFMTGIDTAGNESGPSEPVYVPSWFLANLDVNSKNEIFTAGDGVIQRIDHRGVVHPFPTRSPRGWWIANAIAIGPKDELLVLSGGQNGVCTFGLDNRPKARFGEKGSADGQLDAPTDIDLDKAGNIYIADTGNNRIAVFAPDGTFIANVATGKLEKPVAVEVDINGNLYVIQQQKPGLIKVPRQGDAYGDPALLVETSKQPWAVTSDAQGRIYVSRDAEPGLLVLDADGNTLATLATWRASSLRGIAEMTPDRGRGLVCFLGNTGKIIRIPINEILKPQ